MKGLNYFLYRIEQWTSSALDLIYPSSAGCPLCRSSDCSCKEEYLARYMARQCCSRCGKFLAQEEICLDCCTRGGGFPDKVFALAPYEGNLREALHRFKYQGDIRTGRFLARLLLEGPGRDIEPPELIVPIPLYPGKLRQRGYNQALVLAREVAIALKTELAADILLRVLPTEPMAGLGREERKPNLAGAFTLVNTSRVQGKRVLLVDDIITTGSTLETCGGLLRRAGANKLQALCAAAGRQ